MAIAQFENCLRIMSSKIVNCLGGKGAISSVLTEIGALNSPLECSHCSKVHNGRASSPAGSAFFCSLEKLRQICASFVYPYKLQNFILSAN